MTETTRSRAAEIRNLPASMLDARLLADYAASGEAYDLSQLCFKADISLRQVIHISVARGLDNIDRLPGYAMTADIYELAENIYALGASRREWLRVRTRHKPDYLEGRISREDLRRLLTDQASVLRHYARVFFQAWAVFWDEAFLIRMIDKVDSRIIENVPDSLLNESICFAAVAKSGQALRFVPESLRSLPVCARAVENDASAIAFVPARLRQQARNLRASEFD